MADNWKHRSKGMVCYTCMFFAKKSSSCGSSVNGADGDPGKQPFGRCRRNAPTMNGFPAVFGADWCGNHKLDENKL